MEETSHPLRELRHQYGFSQIRLANAAGLSKRTIQAIEYGQVQRPATDTVTGLCVAFGLDRPAMVSVLVRPAAADVDATETVR